jgi:hypothetical protein
MHQTNKDDFHYNSSYDPKLGFCAGISADSIRLGWFKLRFTLQFDQLNTDLKASYELLGGGKTTKATVDKSMITLGFFPVNFQFFHHFAVNLGVDVSGLIHENFRGTTSGYQSGNPGWNWSKDLKDASDHFSARINLGICGRIAYDFRISNVLSVSPQYQFYYGLTPEFDAFPDKTTSMQHYFCIGIKKKMK